MKKETFNLRESILTKDNLIPKLDEGKDFESIDSSVSLSISMFLSGRNTKGGMSTRVDTVYCFPGSEPKTKK